MPVPPGAGLESVIADVVAATRETLESRRVAVDSRVAPGTPPPRCPPANLRRAVAAFLSGLSSVCPPGSSIVIRSERKPVLLRSKDGVAYRLVKEVGGFTRFAPLPGGTLETRVFLPAV